MKKSYTADSRRFCDLRLLLDEHFSHAIATGLRERKYDVVAVTEQPALIGLPDDDLLEHARHARRALVTENVADFVPLVRDMRAREVPHGGVVLAPARAFRRHRDPVGLYVRSLGRLLDVERRTQDPTNGIWWLAQ